jgi:hypothetical protein
LFPSSASRFTLHAHPLVDVYIKKQLKSIVRYLCEQHPAMVLSEIWLGGSFGRGEGAVLRSPTGDKPVGDYDVFLIYADTLVDYGSYQRHYAHWEKVLSRQLNFQVQLRTPGSLPQLYQSAYALRWYDLCQKHQKLWIAPHSERQALRASLPPLEVSNSLRLLFWCAGVVLTQQELGNDDFYRIILWICDSVLIASAGYHHTLEGQLQNMYRLQHTLGVTWLRELFYLQQEAIRYRTEPELTSTALYKSSDLLKPFVYQAYLSVFTGIEQQGSKEAFQALRPAHLLKGFDRLDFLSGSKKQTGWLLYALPFLMLPLTQWPALSRLRPFISLRLYRRLYPLSPEAQRDLLRTQFLERWLQFSDGLRP